MPNAVIEILNFVSWSVEKCKKRVNVTLQYILIKDKQILKTTRIFFLNGYYILYFESWLTWIISPQTEQEYNQTESVEEGKNLLSCPFIYLKWQWQEILKEKFRETVLAGPYGAYLKFVFDQKRCRKSRDIVPLNFKQILTSFILSNSHMVDTKVLHVKALPQIPVILTWII